METGSDRPVILLIHGLWFQPDVWTPWLGELDQAGYDAVVLPWTGGDGAVPGFDELLTAARGHIEALPSRPIVIGHGVGGAVAERLLSDGDAAAAISLAPVPGGYPAVPAATHLLRHRTRVALLGLHGGPVTPTFPQFRQAIASVGSTAAARKLYESYIAAGKPRAVLFHAVRHRTPARNRQPPRGPLLLAAGGKDELIRETSIALLHRDYRRRQPDAVTDYQVFPGMDHTLGLGTQDVVVLFHCLDWLTAQNM